MNKLKIGITIGDINGIGPEVIIKALSNELILNHVTPIIYGSSKVMAYHKNIVENPIFSFTVTDSPEKASRGKINVINCWHENVHISLGSPSEDSGKCAYIALDRAVEDLKAGKLDALVTAPINKHAMSLANFPYPGHTEFIADRSGNKDNGLMMMISKEMKIGLATAHIPVSKIPEKITKEIVFRSIQALNNTMRVDFGLEKPTIAVLGLNPHAGEQGILGTEEMDEILPAIEQSKEEGILASGPYAADGFFGSFRFRHFDAILSMYHDQGLIPFKTLSFGSGVNFTAGLNMVRTSPDHGTAYEIAGKNQADESSFREALYLAADIAKRRSAENGNPSDVERKSIEKPLEAVEE